MSVKSVKVTDRDHGFRRLQKMLKKATKSADVRVGWFQKAQHPSGISTASIATIHEYGAPRANIPKRPMLRPTVDRNREEYKAAYREAWGKAIDGVERIERGLLRFGHRIRNDVIEMIVFGDFEELKAATIARKGSSKPLQDTGTMRDQIEVRVV